MSTVPEHDPNNNPLGSYTPDEELAPLNGTGVAPHISEPEPAQALPPEANFPEHSEPSLFQSWSQPEIHTPARIPNLGHLGLLILFAAVGYLFAGLLLAAAMHFHLFGVKTIQQANSDIHYTLGSEAVLYLATFAACLIVFPRFWHKSFFAGIQWNGITALRLRGRLFGAACLCFILAMIDTMVLPGPAHAPIDKLFESQKSAWLLFIFGVTFAPFFEEMLFRGFLLPALCTAWDWTVERITDSNPRPLYENGHPRWSLPAMVASSIAVSIPFALMHAEQTAHAVGPFLLLVCVSIVLCCARLAARSLAASVLVHASYNFLLFSLMILGTGGFQHMEKM